MSGVFQTSDTILISTLEFTLIGGVLLTPIGNYDDLFLQYSVQNVTNNEFTANIKVYDETLTKTNRSITMRWFAWGR